MCVITHISFYTWYKPHVWYVNILQGIALVKADKNLQYGMMIRNDQESLGTIATRSKCTTTNGQATDNDSTLSFKHLIGFPHSGCAYRHTKHLGYNVLLTWNRFFRTIQFDNIKTATIIRIWFTTEQACVFPFTWNGATHNECIMVRIFIMSNIIVIVSIHIYVFALFILELSLSMSNHPLLRMIFPAGRLWNTVV